MFAHRVGLLVFLGALAWPQGENGGEPPTIPSFTLPYIPDSGEANFWACVGAM